jgi:mannose-1-phosphate guanylyltransferase
MLMTVIFSGGSRARLWPVSREAFATPFMRLGGAAG